MRGADLPCEHLSPVTSLAIAIRALAFALSLLAIGAAMTLFVLRRSALSAERHRVLRQRSGAIATWCFALLVPIALARLYVQLDGMRFPGEPLTQSLRPLLEATEWGKAWVAQMCAALAGLLAARRVPAVAALAAVCAGISLSFSGHAAAVEPSRIAALVADTVHVLGAGAWLGTLAIIAALWSHTADTVERQQIVRAFSPIALTMATALVLTGVALSLIHVPLDAFFTSRYGRILLLKVALVAGVIASGWLNWKRNTAAIAADDGAAIRTGMRRELAFAAAVVLVTAVLTGTAPPVD